MPAEKLKVCDIVAPTPAVNLIMCQAAFTKSSSNCQVMANSSIVARAASELHERVVHESELTNAYGRAQM